MGRSSGPGGVGACTITARAGLNPPAEVMSPKKLLTIAALGLPLCFPSEARATDRPSEVFVQPLPRQPPYPPPSPQYTPQSQYPSQPPYQPQYPPQPSYVWPHAYRDGDLVPPGYHVEEQPRHGMVVAGWVLLVVPYALSAVTALGTKGDNATSWLYAPVLGPWMVLGNRSYNGCGVSQTTSDGLGCLADVWAAIGLIADGVMQAAGVALLIAGYADTKPVLVPGERALRVVPMRIGTANGLGLDWRF